MWLPADVRQHPFLAPFLTFNDAYYARTLTEQDWTRWYDTRLQEVVAHVKKGSPFYAEHLQDVDPSSVSTGSLAELPFTTKQHLRTHLHDVLSGDLRDATFFYETTGTTGAATPCPRDAQEVVASNLHVTRSWQSIIDAHFPGQRPVIGLMGPTEVHSFGDTLGDVARNIGSCNAKIWPYSPVIGFRKALQLMKDLRLEVICCTPGVCLNLAAAAHQLGYDLRRDFALKLIFVTGEMCTPELAANIDDLWDVSTYNILYGSQEAFVMGTACRHRTMHLSQPNYLAEVLDVDTLQPVDPGQPGELCVTTLVPGIKPLIRYRTGDLVRMTPSDCDCELPGPRLAVIGRVLDRIDLGGSRHAAAELEAAVLHGVRGCLGFQIVIDHAPDGSGDQVSIRAELLPGTDDAALRAAPDRFRERFGVPASLEVVDTIDQVTSTGAFVSWKAARVLDRRTAPDAEAQVAARMARGRGFDT